MPLKSPRASLLGHLGLLDLYALARRLTVRSQVGIIIFHHVYPEDHPLLNSNIAVNDFERVVSFLRKAFNVLPLGVLADKLRRGETIPRRSVCLTFDDGYRDNYIFAYPILRKYGVTATIFLTTNYIGNSDARSRVMWDDKVRLAMYNTRVDEFALDPFGRCHMGSLPDRRMMMDRIVRYLSELSPSERGLMVDTLLEKLQMQLDDRQLIDATGSGWSEVLYWKEVAEMSSNGISFGAHTVYHPELTKISASDAQREVVHSKKTIEERLGMPCSLFAYPFGRFNNDVTKLVRDAGFACAVTTVPRLVAQGAAPHQLSRLEGSPNFYAFKYHLSGLGQDLSTLFSAVRPKDSQG